MTTPREEQPSAGPPPVTPTVNTAPPRSRWHVSAVPNHLGRARTSTVVLVVLFVAIVALYVVVRPDPTRTVPAGSTGGVPAQPTTTQPVAPRTTPPATTTPLSTTPTTTTSTVPTTSTTSQRTASPSATVSSGPATSTSGGAGPVPTLPTAGSPSS